MPDEAIEIVPHSQLTKRELMLTPGMDVATAKKRLEELQQFIKFYLTDKGKHADYGTIPGTDKPTLLKPGADKLCEVYLLEDDYLIVPEYSREEWDRDPPLFDYTVKCILTDRRTGVKVSSGLGSCNSYEGKYKWRDANRKCPKCGKESIIKGKEQYGGGWLCWAKKDGCGAKFADGDQSIEGQQSGKVPNDDLATYKNTILKMAKKRAKIDATLSATRSSGIFTQDMDDITYSPEPETFKEGSQEEADEVAREKLDNVPMKNMPESKAFAKEVVDLQKLLAVIREVDKTLTADEICKRYFVKKDGTGCGYDEVKFFHTDKQLRWVHGQTKKMMDDYANILAPPADDEAPFEATDADLPF